MMENPRSEEEKITKAIRNFIRIKKEQKDTAIKDIKNLFSLKKEVKVIKDIVLRNIKNLFEHEKEEENCYKPIRVNNFWVMIILNTKVQYLDKIRPYLRDITNDLKQSDTWKNQLTITISFISSKDDNNEERVMDSKSD